MWHLFSFIYHYLTWYTFHEYAGFFVTIYITAFLFKSNDILKKQTALKVRQTSFFYTNDLYVLFWHLNLVQYCLSLPCDENYVNLHVYITRLCDYYFFSLFVSLVQGERKLAVLMGYFLVFTLHVIGIYWWYRNDDISYPLIMVPPKEIPPFWHALFTILVNGKNFFLSHVCIF